MSLAGANSLIDLADIDNNDQGKRKCFFESPATASVGGNSKSMSTVSTSDHSASHAVPAKRFKHGSALPQGQMTLFGHSADPHIVERVNIAIADLLHSNGLPSSLAEDDKFTKLISLSRQLPKKYVLPNRKKVGGQLLDAIYEESFKSSLKTLLSESKIYGVSVFGDGATVAKIPLINVLGASPNNSFALLDIIDCTSEMASGGKKTASYIAGLLKPVIKRIEEFRDPISNQSHPGVVDLLLFDGASNVQNAGKHLAITNPRITVVHGTEHVVSLFFKDVFTKVPVFIHIAKFVKRCRNIFGSTRHGPHALFKKYSKEHNGGIYLGFIKVSECRMAGELIALLRMLRLKDALRATIRSAEYLQNHARLFRRENIFLESDEFWKYIFTFCRALYSPMRILRLADKKEAAMDKLYYFVHQTDATLPKYLKIAEEDSSGLLEMDQTLAILKTMSMTASDKYDNESDNEGSDIDSSDDDSLGGFPARDDDEDILSATDDDEENGGHEYESDTAFTSNVMTPKDRCGQVYFFDAVYCR